MPSIASKGIQETDVTEDSIRATKLFLLGGIPAGRLAHRALLVTAIPGRSKCGASLRLELGTDIASSDQPGALPII
jgi:hypothetical protein